MPVFNIITRRCKVSEENQGLSGLRVLILEIIKYYLFLFSTTRRDLRRVTVDIDKRHFRVTFSTTGEQKRIN